MNRRVKSSLRSQPPQSIRRLVPASSERIPLAQAPPGRSWCRWLGLLLRCGPPGGRRFSITVKMDLKFAAVITAIGLGVSGGLAVAGVGAAAAPVGLR